MKRGNFNNSMPKEMKRRKGKGLGVERASLRLLKSEHASSQC